MNNPSLREVLVRSKPRLQRVSPGAEWLDLQLLAAHALGKDRTWVLLHQEEALEAPILTIIEALVDRRASGEAMAYILGHRDFWKHSFLVGPGALVPRPETEELVSWVLEDHQGPQNLRVHDCFTGTGCIPLSLAMERPHWRVSASDISAEALAWAQKNRDLHRQAAVNLFEADLLDHPAIEPHSLDIITANPPYVSREESRRLVEAEGWREPILALDGGTEGWELIQRFLPEARDRLKAGGALYLELGHDQAELVAGLGPEMGFPRVEVRQDLAGINRVLRFS